ncbi:uncharacterized protein N7496_001950 [Penicillium cataractarum]|uniref:Uncharacterized protein n=1 Tax=Penicillium cataractarum TaxID=2100454 RepID=A0A9W9VWW7_9EURO|nr:uncharacterized protein N7496_001950 [Penicillium cataractarum]KAJ5390882.1 hypothetical protein N7496_001950 [Penicillium cataractarum]
MVYTGNQHPGFIHSGITSSQPQWQLEGHQRKSSNVTPPSSDQYSLSSLSQPFHGSNATPQTSGLHSRGLASRSSHPSIASQSGDAYSGNPANPANTLAGHPLSRSQSHQNTGFQYEQQAGLAAASYAQPSSYDYGPQLPNAQGSFQSPDMLRMQPGTRFNSGFFAAGPSVHGDAQVYQYPISQAGVRQYLPPQHQGSSQHDGTNHHAANYHPQPGQFTANQGQWTTPTSASRIAASDPQFVSGPWASSTPPASGPPQPHHG